MIPLVDLAVDKALADKIKADMLAIFDSKSYILGGRLESFERKFAKFLGALEAVGVANGTDALRIALRALDIGRDDKVLTVSFTSPFTSVAIVEEGAIPVYCDIDENTWTIDVADAARKIDNEVRAIMPVHIYGNPCDMRGVLGLAKKYRLKVIEDACQAHGAMIGAKKIGNFSDAAAFSFYPTKNLGAAGDAGMVVTNSKRLAKKMRALRHGGQTRRFWHAYRGLNSRLDEIQAVILENKLTKLERDNLKREKIALRYQRELKDLPIVFQKTLDGAKSAHHLFAIACKNRDRLADFLQKRGVGCDVYYPYPVHLQPAFRQYARAVLEKTLRLSKEILALPIYPSMSAMDQAYVIKTVKNFYLEK